MDIGSGKLGPAGGLSNFRPRLFTFDDIECTQVGRGAKKRGSKRNKAWKSKQILWWNGVSYKRDSQEYQDLFR